MDTNISVDAYFGPETRKIKGLIPYPKDNIYDFFVKGQNDGEREKKII